MNIANAKNNIQRSSKWIVSILVMIVGFITLGSVSIQPFRAAGGVVWFESGPHYINEAKLAQNFEAINAPYETKLAETIKTNTPSCDTIENGFCLQSTGDYAVKSLVKAAVAYVPATPDTKKVIGYCTLCNDGSFSPSCAVGRGACSWHGGVAAYNVARYTILKGKPEIQAQPAEYSYIAKSYKDSQLYTPAAEPSLKAAVHFSN